MKITPSAFSQGPAALRTITFVIIGIACVGGALIAQQVKLPLAEPGQASPNFGRLVPRPEGAKLKVPARFTISIYADNLPGARTMQWAPNGDLFVAQTSQNSVTVLRDANNDGVPETRFTYAQGAAPAARGAGGGPGGGARGGRGGAPGGGPAAGPTGAAAAVPCTPPAAGPISTGAMRQPFGLAFQNGYLYVGNTDSIVRYRYHPGDTQAGEPEKLVDLPGGGGHFTRNVIFSRDGRKMYVSVGSQSNNNAGEDCRRAAILEFNPDGTGYRIFASGIRNPVGLALQPGTNVLWTAVNERDNLGDNLVPDYITSVKDGGFYGWPYSYIGQHYDPRYVGGMPDLVQKAIVPDVLIQAHSAALGITFYTGKQFPQRFRNGAFVGLHGSWNRSTPAGYRVAFVPFRNGKPAGDIEDFVTGFVASEGTPITYWGRPVGVTVARDGSLLISDDSGGRIWKVSYTGNRDC